MGHDYILNELVVLLITISYKLQKWMWNYTEKKMYSFWNMQNFEQRQNIGVNSKRLYK